MWQGAVRLKVEGYLRTHCELLSKGVGKMSPTSDSPGRGGAVIRQSDLHVFVMQYLLGSVVGLVTELLVYQLLGANW